MGERGGEPENETANASIANRRVRGGRATRRLGEKDARASRGTTRGYRKTSAPIASVSGYGSCAGSVTNEGDERRRGEDEDDERGGEDEDAARGTSRRDGSSTDGRDEG